MDGDPGPFLPVALPLTAKRKAKPAHTASAWALSLALNLLFLSSMVVGLRVIPPLPEDRPIEVQLLPPIDFKQSRPAPVPTPSPAPAPAPAKAERPVAPRPELRPRLTPTTPQVGSPPPLALPPPAPAPTTKAPEVAGPLIGQGDKGYGGRMSGRAGCENPGSYHLTERQQAACEQDLAERAKTAAQIQLQIAKNAQAEYDKDRACHDAYQHQGIPHSAEGSNIGVGGAVGSVLPNGLGYTPSLKECGPGHR